MTDEQKKKLEQQLWNIANVLRGKMDADGFRDYILGFIFYKYLSEKMRIYADDVLAPDGVSFTSIDENTDDGKALLAAVKENALGSLGYFLKPSELFSSIAARGVVAKDDEDHDDDDAEDEIDYEASNKFILGDLQSILDNIEKSTMGNESEDDFDKLFEDLDLNSTKLGRTVETRNKIVAKILGHLNNIDFRLHDIEADVLGDAYEYLIGQFASNAGKKAGEFYTPQQVSKILAKLVTSGKSKLKNIYDPTCGSGSLLLRVAREVDDVAAFYGQELNRTTYNLARMNMILHDVHYSKFDIRQEDTLTRPQHTEQTFEAIVANPPFSAKWSASKQFETDERFAQYGKLAPSSKADFAFVQHMLSHLDDNGQMAVILPHGVLFRGAAEGHIRRYIIEDLNNLDAVIGLPANIFYGTSIPTCILVFKACREHSDNVLFIDASNDFDKVKNQNELSDDHVKKIVDTYRKRKSEPKYSHVAPLTEIADNDYNLNIPRYVDTFEEEEPIDLDAVATELKQLEQNIATTNDTIADFCKQLNIATPF